MDKEMLEEVKKNFLLKEKELSQYACKDSDAIRLYDEDNSLDIRPNFYHDIDRIIHSMAYTRYVGKTQVFSFNSNDHVSNRMIHVQLVSKIARTIGRALKLNEDLIEAMALGHDIGHTPLGHTGEYILNDISKEYTNTMFNHNIEGVRVFKDLEKDGAIFYMNGKNGTAFDWYFNDHFPAFFIFYVYSDNRSYTSYRRAGSGIRSRRGAGRSVLRRGSSPF